MHRLAKLLTFVSITLLSFYSIAAQNSTMTNHIDFTNPNEAQNWVIVNDTVMGGRSKAAITLKDGSLVFSGDLSLQNNGGFASTRRIDQAISWDTGKPFEIKVLGDGRNYQFRLRTNRNVDGVAYVANFKTQKDLAEFLNISAGKVNQLMQKYRDYLSQKEIAEKTSNY